MADNVSGKGQATGTMSGKKRKKMKNILCTPFKETSHKLDKETQGFILRRLLLTLTKCHPTGSKISKLKNNIKLGVNETTKQLERNALSLVLTDPTANLPTMYVRQLCGVRKCAFICLNHFGVSVAKAVGVSRLACLGFMTNCESDFQEFVDFALPLAPAVQLPWLEFETAINEHLAMIQQGDDYDDANDEPDDTEMDQSGHKTVTEIEDHGLTEPVQDGPQLKTLKSPDEFNKQEDCLKLSTEPVIPKRPAKRLISFGSSFIAVEPDSDSSEETSKAAVSHVQRMYLRGLEFDTNASPKDVTRVKCEQWETASRTNWYQPANIGSMQANENRKRRKRKNKK